MLNLHDLGEREYDFIITCIRQNKPIDEIVYLANTRGLEVTRELVGTIKQEYVPAIKKLAVDALLEIKSTDWDEFNDIGLCMTLDDFVLRALANEGVLDYIRHEIQLYANRLFSESFMTWGQFSGSIDYPVPAPQSFKNDPKTPSYYQAYVDLPHWKGEYGSLRLSLLNHAIKYLQ
ncbi:hypothetical protein KNT64_gp200 [Pseudomonas phage PspYZU05]|uniref:Uncharacterized protein n=1 Tax=Pseudomonas phage PspYZU05 TaxID=1983556 RepID=A0A2U7NS27_9CAUD|nr:hypothetical protein KNT64_gp200 [Pseudomonas phage PspYZU05]ASD52152.1 hypothetical protein PspYZU05_200 [Pseudomonas phage PspYZU05]